MSVFTKRCPCAEETAMVKKWTCGVCGGEVIEGQRFTFLGSLGAVHVECLTARLAGSLRIDERDLLALLDANEALLYAIVRLKEADKIAGSEEVKVALSEVRASIEKSAGKISSLLQKLQDRQ